MKTDLETAYDAIAGKQPEYNDAWRYYLGNQPIMYANERLREVFRNVTIKFIENWCAVVVDTIKERLNLTGFSVEDESAQAVLDAIWEANELGIESDDLHEAALVCGESYLVIWPNEAGEVELYYNDPRMCHVFYQADRPRVARYAAKLWQGDDELARMTLYYPERLEYYISQTKAESLTSSASFRLDEAAAPGGVAINPYGEIPVFRFVFRRQGLGMLTDVIPMQNGVNKLLTDMMVAAEYGAFKQRWVISNSDVDNLRNAPNEIWSIPAGDGMGQATSVGEFSATELNNYLSAIDNLSGAIAKITRLPKHYFFGQAGDPSGEALIAMEAPLNRQVDHVIERFTTAWKKAAVFALKVAGTGEVALTDIEPVYRAVETIQPKTEAEIRVLATQAGIPLVTHLRMEEGWSDDELQRMQDDKKANMQTFGGALLSAFEKGDQGGEDEEPVPGEDVQES